MAFEQLVPGLLSALLVTIIRRLVYKSLSISEISSLSGVRYFFFFSLFLQFISSMYLSLCLYLYTGYYSVYRTFIDIPEKELVCCCFQKPLLVNCSPWRRRCVVSGQFIQSVTTTIAVQYRFNLNDRKKKFRAMISQRRPLSS